MVGVPAASAVFDFENILPQLDFLPIAARRALDHAGLRLSLEAWRSLALEDRCQLVAAGADDIVDSSAVAAVVRRASPLAQRIEVVGDPDPLAPPDGLLRLLEPVPLDARQWARLRALDRYALAHVHRRSIARNDPTLIQAAYEDIVMGHLRSLRPPPGEAGGRSTLPPPEVPLSPPPLPPPLPHAGLFHAPPVPAFSADLPPHDEPAPSRPARLPVTTPTFRRPPPPPLEPAPADRSLDAAELIPEGEPLQPMPPEIPELTPPRLDILSTHLTETGDARMVDVGEKPITSRRAVATATVHMRRETFRRLAQNDTPKGDVLAAARIAGIMAAKRTSDLIPLCHGIAVTSVEVQLDLDSAAGAVCIVSVAEAVDRTGVEMEALVAASIAGLTIYDMLKGIDRDMSLTDVKLLEKSGGRTGNYLRRDA